MSAASAVGRRVWGTSLCAFFVVAALAATLVLAAPAWGAKVIYPNTPAAQFGSDGTDATTLNPGGHIAFNRADKRFYVSGSTGPSYGIFGFDVSTPGTYTPLEASDGFPIDIGNIFPNSSGLATDSLSGNIYFTSGGRGTASGWTSSGVGLPGFPLGPYELPCGIATDSEGNVWVADANADTVYGYDASGQAIGSVDVSDTDPCAIAIDADTDDLYVARRFTTDIYRYERGASGYTAPGTFFAKVLSGTVAQIAVDPVTHNVFAIAGSEVTEFSADGGVIDSITGISAARGVTIDPDTNTLYVRTNGKIQVYEPLVTPDVTATAPANVTTSSATLTGDVDPLTAGPIVDCKFEWGPVGVLGYPNQAPCDPPASPGTPITSAQDVSAEISGLNQGAEYRYQLTATNANGTTRSNAVTFQTLDEPAVSSLYSSDITPTTVKLHAAINPNGAETTYRFEYGPTTNYGTSVPIPDGNVGSSYSEQEAMAQLTNLQEGIVYHFRVVATNPVGTTATRDQTFNFFPPPCPNASVRQQTGSEYLPDCRAYELVSPEDAGNVVLFDYGLPASYATNPPRFSFGGGLGGVKGTEPPNSLVPDSYVATRSTSGWHTSYVGVPGSETNGAETEAGSLDLSLFSATIGSLNVPGVPQPPDNLPLFFTATGDPLGRWPGNWAVVPDAITSVGDYQPSPDFSHMAFSSNNIAFADGGLTAAPGSAYDYDAESGTTMIISKTASGDDIPQEPGTVGAYPEERILFADLSPAPRFTAAINPGVSTDGSHVLMATLSEPDTFLSRPLPPQHLYMRVDNAITYDVSRGHAVDYAGMTADASRVYFTSPEQLIGDDTDNSVDLYMWSEEGDALTLVSIGSGGGNGNACGAEWIDACDVRPVEGFANDNGTANRFLSDTDYPIATEAGDIYFYSPEQLDGTLGLPGAQNLYVFRDAAPQFVATIPDPAAQTCSPQSSNACSNGPIGRIQVSLDGEHMAFVTASQMTSYDNAGFQQMYTYDPDSGEILCVSCTPDGSPPSAHVRASYNGLFMSNDGRTFFATTDPLVPQDTNGLTDVYEFVDGRPQLITSGTAEQDSNGRGVRSGLAGVSADGVNVFFSTFETLVLQDHNGPFRKFYVARTNGGFPVDPAAAPCEAADECHGLDSSQPVAPPVFSDGQLGAGGNFSLKRRQARKRGCAAKGKRAAKRRCVKRRRAKRRRAAKRKRNQLRKQRQGHRRNEGGHGHD